MCIVTNELKKTNRDEEPKVAEDNSTAHEEKFNGVIRIEEGQIRSHVDEMVRSTVEETLNSMLSAEADALCGAQRYERSADRVDTRAGHYERKLLTKAGPVKLDVPRLRKLPFETVVSVKVRTFDFGLSLV